MRALFSGSGPGRQTADGCSVELYRRLPYLGELEPVGASFEAGPSVLELGCGTGRLTRRMLEWGAKVTAVDNSADMLAEVPSEASKVLADIESLQLGRQFSLVVLASNLINHPTAAIRQKFLSAARRHLILGSKVLVERHDPEWLANAELGMQSTVGSMSLYVESAQHEGSWASITLRYTSGSEVWRQSFQAVVLREPDVEALLSEAGFSRHTWFGSKRRWVESVAA